MADREGAKNNGSTVTVGDFIFEGYKKKNMSGDFLEIHGKRTKKNLKPKCLI